jgi:hypothetical protein
MATRAANQGGKSFRIPFALLVLAVTGGTFGGLVSLAYRAGAAVSTEVRFFMTWDTPSLDDACAVCPVEYALRTNESNDVIFLGDSTCRTSLDPVQFQRLTGLSAYNLGSLRGIGPEGFVITAKAYLMHHVKPRAVVLCVTPTCFEADPGTVGGPMTKIFAANYGPEVAEVVPLFERISYFCKRGALATWRPGDDLKWRGKGGDVRDLPLNGLASETYRTLQRKTREARGFFRLPGAHGPPKGIGKADNVLIRKEWTQGIRRLAQICKEAGVVLVIHFAPTSAEVLKARDLSPLETWSRELESSYPQTVVARPIVVVYDGPLMWDSIHLNSAGVEKFLPVVAQDLQAVLDK